MPLRALCEAVRSCIGELAVVVRQLIDGDLALSDLAVLVHAGDSVPEGHLAWHTDAPNSVLHLAVAIGQVERTLFSRRTLGPDPNL